MALLQERDMRMREMDSGGKRPPRCHFFNTFFMNK